MTYGSTYGLDDEEIKKMFEERRQLRECPLYDDSDNKCNQLEGNKDSQVLFDHLMTAHPQQHLAKFIKEGVEVDWD